MLFWLCWLALPQLTNLIRDTVWLKSYLSAVLRVEAEAFQSANLALGQMKAALPAPSVEQVAAILPSVPNTPPDVIPANRHEVCAMHERHSRCHACRRTAACARLVRVHCLSCCLLCPLHEARCRAPRRSCCPQADLNQIARKVQRGKENGTSVTTGSALASKESLYTLDAAPMAPAHRIAPAAQQPAYADRYSNANPVPAW